MNLPAAVATRVATATRAVASRGHQHVATRPRPRPPARRAAPAARVPRWPLYVLAVPATVAIWGGWVGLGQLCGFGPVNLLPGIGHGLTINLVITLPVGMEVYGAYALGVALSPAAARDRATQWFAGVSAVFALACGYLGQVGYHVMRQHHITQAPLLVTIAVSGVPVLVLGCAATLIHLNRAHTPPPRRPAEAPPPPLPDPPKRDRQAPPRRPQGLAPDTEAAALAIIARPREEKLTGEILAIELAERLGRPISARTGRRILKTLTGGQEETA